MEKTINMKIQRITLYTALAMLLIAGIILMTGRANAMNDRSVNGSIALPADRTVTVNEGVETKINFGTNYDYTSYYYLRIKASKTGYIVFTNDYESSCRIALCNMNKKVISVGDNSSGDFYWSASDNRWYTILNYGVKKGKTYLIRIKGTPFYKRNSINDPFIGTVKWTNKAVKVSKAGKSKKKATKIKKGKKINGLFTAGDRKAKWYKVKANKKKVKILFIAKKINGTLKAEINYKYWGFWTKKMYTVNRGGSIYGYKWMFTSKVKKNTIYVKIYPQGKTSGAYTLKWK